MSRKVEINCICKDCVHSESNSYGYYYCYYWKYEAGESPNEVDANDFCSNGIEKNE